MRGALPGSDSRSPACGARVVTPEALQRRGRRRIMAPLAPHAQQGRTGGGYVGFLVAFLIWGITLVSVLWMRRGGALMPHTISEAARAVDSQLFLTFAV